jgi:predicted phosphohydrolase
MKIQYCSDLHLEFPENKALLKSNPIKPVGDILVLGGDIVPFAYMEKEKDFFDYLSDNFEMTYWVPGNHEYYHSDISKRSGTVNEAIRKNVLLVNNSSFVHENVKLIFSTLWSRLSTAKEQEIEDSISDFHVIRFQGRFLTGAEFNRMHSECLHYIMKESGKPFDGRTFVVTHHVPTYRHYPAFYEDSSLNEAFVVELSAFIESSGIDWWMYGHHHFNTPDFSIGGTKMITNQMGYVRYNEHVSFRNDKYLEIVKDSGEK